MTNTINYRPSKDDDDKHCIKFYHDNISSAKLADDWIPAFVDGSLTVPIAKETLAANDFIGFVVFDKPHDLIYVYTSEGLSIYDYPKNLNIFYFDYVFYPIDMDGVVVRFSCEGTTYNAMFIGALLDFPVIANLLLVDFDRMVDTEKDLDELISYIRYMRVRNRPAEVDIEDGKSIEVNGVKIANYNGYYVGEYIGTSKSFTFYGDFYNGVNLQQGLVYKIKYLQYGMSSIVPTAILNIAEDDFSV